MVPDNRKLSWIENASQRMATALGSLSNPGSPQRASSPKRAKGGGKTAEGTRSRTPERGIDSAQAEWLKRAVAMGMSSFGEVVDERMTEIEAKVTDVQETSIVTVARVNTLEQENLVLLKKQENTEAEIASLKDNLAQLCSRLPAEGAVRNGPDDVPFEQRLDAVIGNLTWDSSSTVAETQAKTVLTEAGVDPTTHSDPVAPREVRNSCVFLRFHTAGDLRLARLKVAACKKQFSGARTPAFLDAAKTRKELKPNRMLGRAKSFLIKQLATEHASRVVTTDSRARRVFIDSMPMGAPLGESWQWLPEVEQFLTELELKLGKGFIEEA